jgi:hypothetical protein
MFVFTFDCNKVQFKTVRVRLTYTICKGDCY